MSISKTKKLTSDLIKFPSITSRILDIPGVPPVITKRSFGIPGVPPVIKNNQKAIDSIIDFVKKQFKKESVFIQEFSRSGFPSLVITLEKTRHPFLLLVGHLDVVPAKRKNFIPKISKNRIYGRGAGDMKGAIAVMIEVLRHFTGQKKRPSLSLFLSTDEEVGGINGTGYLIKKKGYKPNLVIFPDGGGDLTKIVTHEKGVLQLRIESFGKTGHSSRPWLGENAINKLIEIYSALRELIPNAKKEKWENTLNLGKISGGEAINKIPDSAEMFLDIRYIKEADRKKIIKKITEIIKDKGRMKIIAEGKPFFQNKDNPFVKKYLEIAQKELKRDITFERYSSSSDARFFSEKGIPTIITQIKQGNIHSENEWVDIKEMEKLYNILIKLINTLDI